MVSTNIYLTKIYIFTQIFPFDTIVKSRVSADNIAIKKAQLKAPKESKIYLCLPNKLSSVEELPC